ncbi:hypothetical protein H6G00_01450 [Leptolyngbya sp. FACHB-541]|uniref:hypothetical protein n=1 Tax=Leptolyngbya sp. FACHB-541 TaxID=2692810 RepID=UPI0016898487|nr:hypothetical protein [Leptolyngbya sp. FACHB-541]MBD1995295.1 hypothetical protein [Leptolyngbya sp. FACHB-541]
MTYFLIRIRADNQIIGTLEGVDDPDRYKWDESEEVEVFDNKLDFDRRIAALNPPQKALPKWAQFQSLMLINGPYFRIVGHNASTLALNSVLVLMLGEMGQHPERLVDLINIWNAIAYEAKPTLLEIVSLKGICVTCNVPFTLDNVGRMVATTTN